MSANSHGSVFQYLASSTVGTVFLGTPHRGTQAGKWGEYVAAGAKALGYGSEDSILKDLREDSENLKDLLYEFTLWANRARLKAVCFFEQHRTDYGKRVFGTCKELVRLRCCPCLAFHLTEESWQGCERDFCLHRWLSKGAAADRSFQDQQIQWTR